METDLGRVLDALPTMVWTALPDGNVDYLNRCWSEYTGLVHGEACGKKWQDVVRQDDRAALLDSLRSVVACGEPDSVEARIRHADGLYRWFRVQCTPIRDESGHIAKLCCTATDIEDLRLAEERLRRQELDFQLVVESIPIPVAVTTPSGEVEGLNQLTLDYFGRTLEELKGWKASDVVHPDDLEHTVAAQWGAHQRGNAYNVESRHRRADGVYRWYNVLGLPLRDQQGSILRWLHLLIDVDDRRRAEEALNEGERQSRLIVDTIPGLVAVFGPHGEVETLNKQFLEYLGQTQDEFASWATNGTVHPDELVRHIEILRRSLYSGRPINFETRLRRFDGIYRWFQIRGEAARDAGANVLRWYCLMTDIDERKRAEEALAASEHSLQITIDSIPALAWSARLDGTAEFLSKHYLDYVGFSAEQARDWGWVEAVHPDDLNRLTEIWQTILASESPGEAEARLRRHSGEYRWFLFRVNPLRDASGKVVKWYGVNTDIEDRKRSEERFRAIVETTPECVTLVARDGTVARSNAAGAAMVGAPAPDVVVGQSFFDFVAPEHRSLYREFHERVCAGQKGFLEFDVIHAEGVRRHVETHAAPMNYGDESIVQLGVTRDITERKQVEERLRRSEAFLAEGQHLARMGNFSWNLANGEILWSEQLYRIFEFGSASPMTLDLIATRVHPEDIPLMADMVERAQRGESDFEYQHRIVLPDSSIKHLHLTAHRARDKDHTEYIGAVLDVTQRRLSEETLEKVRSELAQVTRIMSLGVLTASIAHEVNQPLSGIITNASTCLRVLASEPPNIEVAREAARRTIRDGNRAADVIARLRALFSQRAPKSEPIDLNEAAREVIALSLGELLRSRVILHTDFADGIPLVAGDRIQLQQVIMNLLRNAADAVRGVGKRPGSVILRTECSCDGQVCLSVEDAGVGFGPDGTERLFDPFYTTKSDGMGIGLSVSRSIVEAHNGRLSARANDGPGATFSFSIPTYSGDDNLTGESSQNRLKVYRHQ